MVAIADALSGEPSLPASADLSVDQVLAQLTHRVRPIAVLLRQVRNPILVLLLVAAIVSGEHPPLGLPLHPSTSP